MKRAHRIQHPCPACNQAAGVGTIQCNSGCNLWVHRKCVRMTQEDFDNNSSVAEYFICQVCQDGRWRFRLREMSASV